MAFNLKDLAENPKLLDDLREGERKRKIKEDEEQDRYYEELGKLVEEHPIASAGIRRS